MASSSEAAKILEAGVAGIPEVAQIIASEAHKERLTRPYQPRSRRCPCCGRRPGLPDPRRQARCKAQALALAEAIIGILENVGKMGDFPGKRGAAGIGIRAELRRVVENVALERGGIPLLLRHPQDLAVPQQNHALRRIAERARRLDQRIEHGLQVEGRAADDLEHIGGRRLLLQRLVALAGSMIELLLQVSNRRAATRHGLWRIAPLWRYRLAASRFNRLAACAEAPFHCLPQGSGHGIVAAQTSIPEGAGVSSGIGR
jgi:hypothetical protein